MKTYCSIKEELLDAIISQAAENQGLKECGGILIGEYRGPHIAITEITMPGRSDESSFSRFIRVDASHQTSAMNAWLTSSQTQTYVGEWHTHPVGKAIPSSIDKNTWRAAVRRTGSPLLFIIATSIELKAFRGELRTGNRGQKFELANVELTPVTS